jgi:hypothetical protein
MPIISNQIFKVVFSSVFKGVFGLPSAPVNYVLFIPSGSDSLIASDGDTFKVREA